MGMGLHVRTHERRQNGSSLEGQGTYRITLGDALWRSQS